MIIIYTFDRRYIHVVKVSFRSLRSFGSFGSLVHFGSFRCLDSRYFGSFGSFRFISVHFANWTHTILVHFGSFRFISLTGLTLFWFIWLTHLSLFWITPGGGGGVMALHDHGYLPQEFLKSYPVSE